MPLSNLAIRTIIKTSAGGQEVGALVIRYWGTWGAMGIADWVVGKQDTNRGLK